MSASILEASNGAITTHVWLCESHVADRKASGWSLKPIQAPPGFMGRCQDCVRGQRSPASVDFAPTSPGARLPTPEECPRPAPMSPWRTRERKEKR